MKNALAFPKIAGIHIFIHWTFSLLLIWIVYINFRAGLNPVQTLWSILFVLSLFVCVVLHEFGHALTARRYGIKTRDITLYPIGGVARLEKMPEKPVQELLVALAGPAVNVVIMLLLMPFILNFNVDRSDTENILIIDAHNFLPMLGMVNIWLALFNLIPAFPMDGGRVLRALLSMKQGRVKATAIAAFIGKALAGVFVIAGFYLNPFLIFIGVFIFFGAHAEADMVKSQYFISDLKVSDALMTEYHSLEKEQPIADAVKLLLSSEAKSFVVTENGIPYGSIGRDQIIKGIRDIGESGPIEKIANKDLHFVKRTTPLKEVFTHFQQSKIPIVFVMEDNKLAGIIDAENIAELILIRSAKESR